MALKTPDCQGIIDWRRQHYHSLLCRALQDDYVSQTLSCAGPDIINHVRLYLRSSSLLRHSGMTAAIVDESFGGLLLALRQAGALPFWGPAFTASLEVAYKAVRGNFKAGSWQLPCPPAPMRRR